MLVGIVAMTHDGLIGNRTTGLPWHIPTDLKFFHAITKDKILIVGRTTYETLPPLPGRKIVVVTRDKNYSCPECVEVVNDLNDLAKYITSPDLVMVAGGAEIYRQLMGSCDYFYVTEVWDDSADGDIMFPIEEFKNTYKLKTSKTSIDEASGVPLVFKLYERIKE